MVLSERISFALLDPTILYGKSYTYFKPGVASMKVLLKHDIERSAMHYIIVAFLVLGKGLAHSMKLFSLKKNLA